MVSSPHVDVFPYPVVESHFHVWDPVGCFFVVADYYSPLFDCLCGGYAAEEAVFFADLHVSSTPRFPFVLLAFRRRVQPYMTGQTSVPEVVCRCSMLHPSSAPLVRHVDGPGACTLHAYFTYSLRPLLDFLAHLWADVPHLLLCEFYTPAGGLHLLCVGAEVFTQHAVHRSRCAF